MGDNGGVADSESAVVGSLLGQGESVAAMINSSRLAGRHFSCRWRGVVLDVALGLSSRGVSPDVSTVFAELRDHDVPPPEGVQGWGVVLAAELTAALPLCDANVIWHCERIKASAAARAAAETLRSAAAAAAEGNVARAMEICNSGLMSGVGDCADVKTLRGDLETVMRYRVRCFQADTFKALNAPEYSVLRSGLVTIGAEANTGKSSLASAMALDVIENNADALALIYSLDDSVPITGKRILSQLTGRNLFYSSEGFAVEEHAGKLDRIVVRDYFSVASVEAEARALLRRLNRVRVVIVLDYLQIVAQPTGYRGDRREFYNEVVKELKEVQKRLEASGHDCLVLLLSQLSRADNGQTYRYRETSEIENQSDVCLDLYGEMRETTDEERQRTGTNRKQVPDLASPIRNIRVVKNKLGKKGVTFGTRIDRSFYFSAPELRQSAPAADDDGCLSRLGGR